ncbi:methyltransferase domain-containing protein [Jatrophihabitans sp. YIM 134969]
MASPEPALRCRLCDAPLHTSFVDLGMSPPCEDFLTPDRLDRPETFYPLHPRVCGNCLLVQLPSLVDSVDIFEEYAYFSSFSDSWVAHARRFVDDAVERFDLGADSLVVEVASNDGYLLQHVVARGMRALGVEPAKNIAAVANEKGVPTESVFLGEASARDLADTHGRADLVVANNVYAHVPDLVDFTRGLRALVRDDGAVSIEVQHLLRLVERNQYDTIYHEHFQYYTVLTLQRALASGDLVLVDVEELSTHGGSVRVTARPSVSAGSPSPRVTAVLAEEAAAGLHTLEGHAGFAHRVDRVRHDLLSLLLRARAEGATVVGYGAPGKGNTLLNHCGIRTDLVGFTVDRNPYKHGRFLPGTHIPVLAPEALDAARPDYILVLPWNLREEISAQLAHTAEWGARLVFPIPTLEVVAA